MPYPPDLPPRSGDAGTPTVAVAQLLDEARAGDPAAFAALYAGHVRAMRRYARRLAGREHQAEDLVAEAFARTWAQLAIGRGPHEAFAAYLRAVVLNLHLSALKRDRAVRWVPDIEHAALADPDLAARIAERGAGPEEATLEQLFNARLHVALSTLPERWQVVLRKVYVENEPYPSVAAHLGVSVNATRQVARRARQGMRKALDDLSEADTIY